MLTANDFFDLSNFRHADLFESDTWVWDALKGLLPYLDGYFETVDPVVSGTVASGATLIGEHIEIGEGTVVEDSVTILSPCVIGRDAQVKQGAYIRGGAVVGDGSVVGHATEVKHAIFLNDARAPHFAYVGDSILGTNVNLGAGTKLSNLALLSEEDAAGERPSVQLTIEGERVDTGLAKLGAIIGDDAQTGCNSVTNPGCLIGKRTLIYPNMAVRNGYVPSDSILKLRQEQVLIPRRF